ncbi:MAG: cytochrome c4 [Cellvibrionaceae bacterium]|nr:cytochrome c4 [Cellvibrionaceae bacterium]
MKTLYSLTVVFLALFASAVHAAGDANRGKDLVAACVACHADDGNSPSDMFPKLAGLGENYLFKQLQDIQSQQRPVPEMAGQLNGKTVQDLRDMAAFYAGQTLQLSGASALEVKLNSGNMVDGLALGEDLYRAGNPEYGVPACTGCHSPRGLGNAPASYPRLGGQHAAYIEKQLKAFRSGDRVNDGEAMTMRSISRGLSDAEIKALSAYVAGLN